MTAYQLIKLFYRNKSAKRSGLPYINHIDEGLELLKPYNNPVLNNLFCLHPLAQNSHMPEERVFILEHWEIITNHQVSWAYAHEYALVANSFLTCDPLDKGERLKTLLPSVREIVLQALLIDKIQNQKDFNNYVSKSMTDTNRINYLSKYFAIWINHLNKALKEQMTINH